MTEDAIDQTTTPANRIPLQSIDFNSLAHNALQDEELQQALNKARSGFVDKRLKAIGAVEDFEHLRDLATDVRQKTLKNLDIYLHYFEKQVIEHGGHVHWAKTPEDMRNIVIDICQKAFAKKVAKGKSMVGEEVLLNEALTTAGIQPVETDLGEYIIQLAKEKPSHIVAPALHKTRGQIKELFEQAHKLGPRALDEVKDIVDEARKILRQEFLSADLGITGANMLIAETGTAVVVTNEGNGDLSATLPSSHIVTASIDKIVPTWEDASAVLRVLARSATGQPITAYTSFFNGPRKSSDHDGPKNFHIVLLDNRRSELLGSEYQEMLQCIRCGACMNHCPVYQAVGGHTYHSVYPGPMGAVLSPLLFHEEKSQNYLQLANASTFCGRCEAVCPVRIPLPSLMRRLRNQQQQEGDAGKMAKLFIKIFCLLAGQPRLYRRVCQLKLRLLRLFTGKKARFATIWGMRGWTNYRDFPAPPTATFQAQWQTKQRGNKNA